MYAILTGRKGGSQMPKAKSRVALLSLILIALVGVVVAVVLPAAAQSGTSPVTNIEVCNGANAGETVVSWDAAPDATHYRIGYVNMVKDYPRAKNSNTGEWIEAFVYVDVNALNIPVNNGRANYVLRRLVSGDRHAFTVLTSSNIVNTREIISGTYSWPLNPRWQFLTVAAPDPNCTASPLQPVVPTPTAMLTPTPRPTATPIPTPRPTPTLTPTPTPRPAGRAFNMQTTECSQGRQISNTADEIIIRGNLHALRTAYDVTVYGSLVESYLPDVGDAFPILLNVGFHRLGDMAAGEERSFDVSYIHNGSIPSNARCHLVVIYKTRPSAQRQNQTMSMGK